MTDVETGSNTCSRCGKTAPMLKLLQCDHHCCLACLESSTSQQLHLDDSELQRCSACQKRSQATADVDANRDDWVQIDRADAAEVITNKGDGAQEDTKGTEKVDGLMPSTVDVVVNGDVVDATSSSHADAGEASDSQHPKDSRNVDTDANNNKESVSSNSSADSHQKNEAGKTTEQPVEEKVSSNGVEILGQRLAETELVQTTEDKSTSLQTSAAVDGKVTTLDTKDLCKEHQDEVLTMFCKACDQSMCVKCFLLDHKTHEVEDIKFGRDHIRRQLTGFIDRMSRVLSQPETAAADRSEQLLATRKRVDEAARKLNEAVDRDAQLLRDAVAAQEAEIDRRNSVKNEYKLELTKLRSTCQDKVDAGQELVDWTEIKELNKQAEQLEEKLRSMTEDEPRGGVKGDLAKVNFVAQELHRFLPPTAKNLVGEISFGQQDEPAMQQILYSELQDQLQRETRHKNELLAEIELLRQRDAVENGRKDVESREKSQQSKDELQLERERHRSELSRLRQEHTEQLEQLARTAAERSSTDARAQTQQDSRHLTELNEAKAKIAALQKTVDEKERELARLKSNQEEQSILRSAQTAKGQSSSFKSPPDEDLTLSGLADYNAQVLKEDEPTTQLKRRSALGLNRSRTLSTDVDSDPVKVQTTPEPKSNSINRRSSDRVVQSSAKSPTATRVVEEETVVTEANLRPSDVVKSQTRSSTITTASACEETSSSDANVRPSNVVKSQTKSSAAASGQEAETMSSDANLRPSDVVRSQSRSSTVTTEVEVETSSNDANVRPSDVVKSQVKSSATATVSHRPTLDSLKSPSKDDAESSVTSPLLSPDSRRNQNASNAAKQLSPGVLSQYGSVIDCAAVWKAYQEVLDDKSSTQWLKLGREDKKIVVLSTGSTYQQFKDSLTDDQGVYGFVRLTSGDEHAKLPKFVLIMWVGLNVPAPQAAMMTLGKAHVTAIIENRMLEVRASSLQEIDEQVLLEALRKVGGSF